MIEVRIRPLPARGIGIATLRDRSEIVTHEMAVPLVHEGEISGITSRNHRSPESHGFRHGQTEPFTSMKRDITIGCGHHRVLLDGREVTVEDHDVAPVPRRVPESFQLRPLLFAIDALDDKSRSFPRLEGAAKRLDKSQRVLAFKNAEEVEAEQENETVRQPELRSTHRLHDRRL